MDTLTQIESRLSAAQEDLQALYEEITGLARQHASLNGDDAYQFRA